MKTYKVSYGYEDYYIEPDMDCTKEDILVYEAKEVDELLKQKDDKIKEFGSEIVRLGGGKATPWKSV